MSRTSRVVLVAGFVGAFALGFLLGGGAGWQLMDGFCGRLVTSGTAARSGDSLVRHIAVWDAIEAGDVADADKQLRFLIRSEAGEIVQCRADPECARLMSDRFYDPASLERARLIGNLTTRSSGP